MEPTINYYLARARVTDLHRQARRDALIRTARRERRAQRRSHRHSAPARPAFGRRVLIALGVRAA